MAGSLHIATVGDIHCGPVSGTKQGDRALELLDGFLAHADRQSPDIIIELGDRITGVDRETDIANMGTVSKAFAAQSIPRAHLVGNHDVMHLTRAENAEILGQPTGHRVVEVKGWRLIIWQADVTIRPGEGLPRIDDDLAWLMAALKEDGKPTVIFSHVPVSGTSMIGNYYFERDQNAAFYPDHRPIRAAAEAARNVVLWVSGHVHWNRITDIRGIAHVTIQSLTETFTTPPHPAGCFADIRLDDESLRIDTHGRDAYSFSMPRSPIGDGGWLLPKSAEPSETSRTTLAAAE